MYSYRIDLKFIIWIACSFGIMDIIKSSHIYEWIIEINATDIA